MDITDCQTYSCYSNLQEKPVTILLLIFGVTGVAVAPFLLFHGRHTKFTKLAKFHRLFTRYVTEPAMEHFFSSILKHHIDENGEKVYIVLNYKAPREYTVQLFMYMIQLTGLALAQFWDDFLLEESYTCSPNPSIACFRTLTHPVIYNQRLNCSDTNYLRENNITSVICYRFVLNLATATGSALGLVTTTALIVYIITLLLLKVSKGISKKWWSYLTTILIQIILVILTITLTVFLCIYHAKITSTYLSEFNVITKDCIIGFIITTSIYRFPWYHFKKIENDNERVKI